MPARFLGTLGCLLRRHLIIKSHLYYYYYLGYCCCCCWLLLLRHMTVYVRLQEQQTSTQRLPLTASDCQRGLSHHPDAHHSPHTSKHQINIYASKWPLCRVLQSGFFHLASYIHIMIILFFSIVITLFAPCLVYFLIFILSLFMCLMRRQDTGRVLLKS